ncbi:E3 ubiquitin-protein ligase RNF213-like [Watersipora subatra]|uniref:E3 ubiquitin-protein ligase RNF213-like n=1 Tax=Watersipora subatra TaxID=2589382 RepID=UPI00355C28B9
MHSLLDFYESRLCQVKAGKFLYNTYSKNKKSSLRTGDTFTHLCTAKNWAEEVPGSAGFALFDKTRNNFFDNSFMSKHLYNALKLNRVPISEDFDQLPRSEKLKKLRSVMTKNVSLQKLPDKSDASAKPVPVQMFSDTDDPDPNYVLTMDNAKKILAIHQRLRVNIPVIIMGETGCGKTMLIDFMTKLQVPTELKDEIQTMEILKVPTIYTVLFLDEVNTTEAIGLVKEIICDRRMNGVPLPHDSSLKIVAACNPYRRVQALPQSLLPLVWDFGTLQSEGSASPVDSVEGAYIKQMIIKFDESKEEENIHFSREQTPKLAELLAISQRFMVKQTVRYIAL